MLNSIGVRYLFMSYSNKESIGFLSEQIQLLQCYAKGFDNGTYSLTIPMATSIRVLFYHNTGTSIPLIKQLDEYCECEYETFPMISTKPLPIEGADCVLCGDGLFGMKISLQGMSCFPLLANSFSRTMPFCDWWVEDVIKDVSDGFENPLWLSRKQLILNLANKEGGAHIDPHGSPIKKLGGKQAFGWFFHGSKKNKESPVIDQKQATMRQICYEVLCSLHRVFPSSFTEEYY